MIHGEDLWRNPQVFVGNQKADDVEILPDMRGIVATFDKLAEPAGWKSSPPFDLVETWVWTSEGSAPAGDVRLYKPAKTQPTSGPKALFEMTSTRESVTPDKAQKAAVPLTIEFDKKEVDDPRNPGKKIKQNKVDEIFVEFDKVTHDSVATAAANPGAACLDTTKYPWKVTDDCTFTVHVMNVNIGHIFSIKAYRLEKKKKVYVAPIGFEALR